MRPIDVDFGPDLFDEMIAQLNPGESLSAGAILTALDDQGDVDAFEQMDILTVSLDISDLPKGAFMGEAALRLRLEQQLAEENRLPEGLEENDPLRLYLEEIAGMPAWGDVKVLAQQLQNANAEGREVPELYRQLLNLSLSRVVEIAREYTGYGVLLLDLIQEGSLGLWQYLPQFSGDFETERDRCLHQIMKKTVILQAHANGVGQRMRQAMEDYRSVDERLLMELGRNPTLEEIAEAMHVTVETAACVAENLESARMLSRVKREPEPEPEEEQQAVEDTAYFQMRQRISELLSVLSPGDAELLSLRFGLEGGLPMKPEQVGAKLGLTAQEVVERETAALAKLREQK